VESLGTPTLVREPDVKVRSDAPTQEPRDRSRPRTSERSRANSDRRRSLVRHVLNEGAIVFLLALAGYVTVAVLLAFKYGTMTGDAFSRMANGFYVIYSRDPHIAAVGFVWTPLQSVADMVFLLGNHLWPDLSHYDMAGSLVSALAMAGAAYQILSALREWGISRTPRLILTFFFAINPMILLYAGNGMSEGLYMFTLTASTRYLMRWMRRGDLRSLAYAGVALGFGYLARNEAAGAVVLGACITGLVSYSRSDGPRMSRIKAALSDFTIFAIPGFVAATGWAITSYVITGQFFGQFSSIYGNSEQVQQAHNPALPGRILFQFHALEALAPLIPLVLIVSVILAVRRRDPRMLAPLAVLGGAMGFDVLAYLDNSVFSWFRFYIATVPIQVLLVGSIIAAMQSSPSPSLGKTRPQRTTSSNPRAVVALAAVALVLVVMIPATVKTGSAMLNPQIGREESQDLGFIFHAHPSIADRQWQDRRPQILALGNYFAGLHLPNGDIVVDNSAGCIPEVITTISQPKVFVIPNDRDFQRTLADPITFHTHYILEPNPAEVPISATNIQYPTLWNTGDGFTKLVHQIPSRGTCPEFRLFRVVGHSNLVSQ
jgi:hypothetical protein